MRFGTLNEVEKEPLRERLSETFQPRANFPTVDESVSSGSSCLIAN